MAISPYLRKLRDRFGHDLLLLPSVAVLPRDAEGKLLLVRDRSAGSWQTIGGMIEVDERPEDAARRESQEEANVEVRIGRLVAAVGGPGFRINYPNGDEAAYVSLVYEATVVSGMAAPDGDETSEVGWFALHELDALHMNDFTRRLLDHVVPLLEAPGA